ncbi:hypothetical protein GCM10010435_52940 [Winogradskya consettensis]|uniref:Uncharacterized protein n=1 Tax=Winogradskya consettensis TaxID=113560 RepID=A0A919SHB6_9ACTN|nr:hypothetical protein [Actinoplanes consettensis]GIM71684.1 hypothetical protein Aco04nite_26500 [Actinoplanes consettensis]
MNELALLRDHGPDAPEVSGVALTRARVRVMNEIEGHGLRRSRLVWGISVTAALAVAAGTGYTMVPERTAVVQPSAVKLVAFETPVFPLALRPRPAGLKAPGISGGFGDDSQGRTTPAMTAVYLSSDATSDVYLAVDDRYTPQGTLTQIRTIDLDGGTAYLAGTGPKTAVLSWQRRDGQWVTLSGHGRFGTEKAVLSLARTVADDPQPVPLQVRLAPAGWRLRAFKDNTILTLADPASAATLSVSLVPHLAYLSGPQQVTVGGRRGEIVRTPDGWILQVELVDGRGFRLQAPAQLTLDQVIAVAEQVSVGPV